MSTSFQVGQRVEYFHSFFMRKFPATVTKVTKTRVHIAIDPTIYVNSPKRANMTHKQADECLS